MNKIVFKLTNHCRNGKDKEFEQKLNSMSYVQIRFSSDFRIFFNEHKYTSNIFP